MWYPESQAVAQQATSHCLKGQKGKAIPESGHGWQREATSVRGDFYKPFLNKGCTCFSKEVLFFTPTFCDRGSPTLGEEGPRAVRPFRRRPHCLSTQETPRGRWLWGVFSGLRHRHG